MTENTDIIIIGAGPGGYRAAGYAASKGMKVVIIEQAHVGGTCLNEGCIPTKAYARNAELMLMLRESDAFGLNGLHYDFDFSQVLARKNEVLGQLRNGIESLLAHPAITLVRGEGRFVDAHTVAAGDTRYSAPHIIIATGSVPKKLRLCEPSSRPVLDSSDLLQLDKLPQSLCIVGAGVIGMEFASIFSAFGTKVTVVEFLKECLPALDSDIAKRLRKTLEKRGVDFFMQCGVTAITPEGVTFEDKKGRQQIVDAEQVLMAVGRAPRVFEHFSCAGFDYDEKKGILVDEYMQTTVPGIYAIGDVNGRQMLAHAAEMQAKVAVDHILAGNNETATVDLSIMPAAVFTSPEAAGVGLTEDQLKASGTNYECRKSFHRANGKALAMNETDGMVKLLSESDAGRIVGCHAFGAHAADLIQETSVLMCRQTTIAQLRHMVHIHPTLSELLLDAAEA